MLAKAFDNVATIININSTIIYNDKIHT